MDLGTIVAVNISCGGIPKTSVDLAMVTEAGVVGDGHDHDKHNRSHRAISLLDEETIEALVAEGYSLVPGSTGENFTVRNLNVQAMPVGTRLLFSSGVEIELTEPRKPCYVLDKIHPNLKTAIIGRCGYMARVTIPGLIRPDETITPVRVAMLVT